MICIFSPEHLKLSCDGRLSILSRQGYEVESLLLTDSGQGLKFTTSDVSGGFLSLKYGLQIMNSAVSLSQNPVSYSITPQLGHVNSKMSAWKPDPI